MGACARGQAVSHDLGCIESGARETSLTAVEAG
jgi:hypothetical protein